MLRLVSMTPLGKPVVPDVYCMLITSVMPMDRPRASSASSDTRVAASRSDAYGVKPSGTGSPMKMRRCSPGSSLADRSSFM